MPYDEELDDRISRIVAGWEKTDPRKMFGGVCYTMDGHIVCGVHRDYLILRLGQARAEQALESKHVRDFDITGRPMKGWVMVEKDGFPSDAALEEWLLEAKEFVSTLPPK